MTDVALLIVARPQESEAHAIILFARAKYWLFAIQQGGQRMFNMA